MNQFTVEDLEAFLDERFRAFCRSHSLPTDLARPRRDPPFSQWEAQWFMQGIATGLIQIADDSGLESRMSSVRGLFFLAPSRSRLVPGASREGITHCAAAVALVREYGWLPEQVQLESVRYRRAPRWALDLVVWEQEDECVIAGEVKRSEPELDRLIDEIKACAGEGVVSCTRKGHKKYVGLIEHNPKFFWAVSPTRRRAFRVLLEGGEDPLNEVKDMPHRTDLTRA